MSHILEKNISTLVEQQFPEFYHKEGPQFVQFVKSYYEWLESDGQAINLARNLAENRDIDLTLDEFVIHFKNKFLVKLPDANAVGNRKLIKHISDVYRSKGSRESFKLLFRLLFDKEAEIFYPSDDVIKASDGVWFEPVYLELTSSLKTKTFIGKEIVGSSSGAKAFVDSYVRRLISGGVVDIVFISNVRGNFETGELITSTSDNSYEDAPKVVGSLTTVTVLNGGANNAIGDTFEVTSATGVQGKIRISAIEEGTGRVTFEIIDGGTGYTLTDTTHVIVSDNVLTLGNIEDRSKMTNLVAVEGNTVWGQLAPVPPTGWAINGVVGNQEWDFRTSGWNTNEIESLKLTANTTEQDGGFDSPEVTIDPTQTYRYIVPVMRDSTTGGTFALSSSTNNDILLLSGGTNANTEFFTAGANSINMPIADRWYVGIGYIYPHDHVGTANTGGLYDSANGVAEANVTITSYKWKDGAVSSANLQANWASTPDTGVRYLGKPILQKLNTVNDASFAQTGYNADSTSFIRFNTVKQPLIDAPYTNLLPSAGTFAVDDYVVGVDAGGIVAHGFVKQVTANTGDNTGTLRISPIDGDWTTAANIEMDAAVVEGQSTVNALAGALTDITPQGNTTGSNTTFIGIHSVGYVSALTINAGGSDYAPGDILTFTGGGITGGAEAQATGSVTTVSANVITGVSIDSQGFGYDSEPLITVGGAGTGANVSATIIDQFDINDTYLVARDNNVFANVISVSTGDDATFAIGSLTAPTETLSLFTDLIGGVNTQNRSYLDIFLDGSNSGIGFLGSVSVGSIGTGYTNTDVLTFTGGGETSVANADITTFSNGSVDFVTVNDPGEGYDSIPNVIDTSSNQDAAFTPNMDFGYGFPKDPNGDDDDILDGILESNTFTIGQIASLTSINPGSNYNADPMVAVLNPLIAGFNRRDLNISIDSIVGAFAVDERLEQTITSDDQIANVDSTSGFANNDGIEQRHANGDIAAIGLARVVDVGNTEITILPLNGTTFIDTRDLDLSANTSVNTDINSLTNVQVETFAKGIVKAANTSQIDVMRTTFNVAFDSGFPVVGDTSGATANVIQVINDGNTSPMGDNAIISANVETASGIATAVDVIDSGFGYLEGEEVTLNNPDNIFAVTGTTQLGKQGAGEGFWLNNRGRLNSDKFIHDNNFYQEYSYEVRVGLSLDRYADILEEILHVSGTRRFGNVIIPDQVVNSVGNPDSATTLGTNFDGVTDVDPAANTITATGHIFTADQKVRYTSNGLAADVVGLTDFTDYFIIIVDGNTVKMAATSLGAEIDITADGTAGNHTLLHDPV